MTRADARPEALDLSYRPGSAFTIHLVGPADWLDARTFTASLNGTALTVTEDDDILDLGVTSVVTTAHGSDGARYPFILHMTGGNDVLIGTWVASRGASPSTDVTAAVLLDDINVAVTILAGTTGGGGGTVDTIVAGTGIDVDSTDPANPVVSAEASGTVDAVVAGHGVDVDATDPANPVVIVDESELDIALMGGTMLDAQVPAAIARDSEVTSAVAAEATLARNADNLTSGTVADARIASTIARDSEVTSAVAAEATLARNGDNITGGTVADARIASTIARDSEVAAGYQPLDADLTALASAGNSAVLGATTASFLTADETKLDGIATGATANATDAQLRDRSTHTGTQTLSTISDAGTAAALDSGTSSGNVPVLGTGGVLAIGRLATGTPTGSKFVRDDGTLAVPAGGGSGVVETIVEGDSITVDDTDPANPIVGVVTADFATAAQGVTADSAVQPGDLGAVATSNDYGDLDNLPTLGTAAATDATDYATAAQGATADSAVQPGDLSTVATTGAYADLSGKPTLGTAAALDSGTSSGNVAVLGTGGRFDVARVASGTPNGTKFVRDDGTLVTPPAADKLGLTPTAVKTANYTAVAGDLVICNTSSGAFAVTFPSAPADGTVLGIKLITAGNPLTLTLGGSDVFNKSGGAATGSLTVPAQGILCQYKASGAIWYVVADDLPASQLTRIVDLVNTTVTAVNTTTKTTLGSVTLPAGLTGASHLFRIKAMGMAFNNNAAANYTWTLEVGGVTLTSWLVNVTTSGNNRYWTQEWIFACSSAAAQRLSSIHGLGGPVGSLGTAGNNLGTATGYNETTLDNSSSLQFDVKITLATANASISCDLRSLSLEHVPPLA